MMTSRRAPVWAGNEPLWYKDAIIYELHVRSFFDSNGDGIGDFPGLTEKLDYLQDLGITAIWILPFYPSPLKDDGYDIADYTDVNPQYGTLKDFKIFLKEAHHRGLRVITELVVNHTSDAHPWFQRARRAKPGSRWRNFYVWSDTPEKYREARIIFKDFETSNWSWDPEARAYYWHRFYSHQPDLNFDNPEVRQAIIRVLNFWLDLGVDGLRLDAVPYLFERRGTNCENLPETHAFLKELRQHVDGRYEARLFLAEANQWPQDAAAYFGAGDECHMAFHFPLMPRMFMALRLEDRFPIMDILAQTPAIPETCQWALFLRNHDELTLEMVTDEDRDYMYRVYAQDPHTRINLGIRRRLGPLLGNHRRRIELMKALLFSLPGTPVLYYGDELGMGDNFYLGDRNGVRTPMQWSADRNAGFSRANPHQLYLPVIIDPEYHYEAVNVETQQNNPHSLLWWMKRLIALRRRYQAFSRGSLEFLTPDNRKVLAFLRCYGGERLLVVMNLSRFVQYVELDLSRYQKLVPVEVIGRTEFPALGVAPYFLSLGPHSVYWFALEEAAPQEAALPAVHSQPPTVSVVGRVEDIFQTRDHPALIEILPGYLARCRWFGGKARQLKTLDVEDCIPFSYATGTAYITLVRLSYTEGEAETYILPLALAEGEAATQVKAENPQAVVGVLQDRKRDCLLYEAVWDNNFRQALLEAIGRRRQFKGQGGVIQATPTQAFRHIRSLSRGALASSPSQAEQSNTSLIYGDWFIFKLLRRLEPGVNLDLEIGRFLTEKSSFAHNPPLAGALEYRDQRQRPCTIGILHGYVPNQGDAWSYTLDVLGHYFETALARGVEQTTEAEASCHLLSLAGQDPPPLAQEMIGPYLASAQLLGQRTGELHLALASDPSEASFAPEPFTSLYRHSIYQSMRNQAARVFQLLRHRIRGLPEEMRQEAQALANRQGEVEQRFHALVDRKITALRIRIHGDYHLGQVLHTGKDFIIIDFEGEPARPLSERRLKRSPLRDVAGMLRSFHYAAYHAICTAACRPEDRPAMEKWAEFWHRWVAAAFLQSYLAVATSGAFLPHTQEELQILLDAFCLEKAVYELGYELNNRPHWVRIPLLGIQQMLD